MPPLGIRDNPSALSEDRCIEELSRFIVEALRHKKLIPEEDFKNPEFHREVVRDVVYEPVCRMRRILVNTREEHKKIAALCLQGLLANPNLTSASPTELVQRARRTADTLQDDLYK